jgi:two-component system response regulator RegA
MTRVVAPPGDRARSILLVDDDDVFRARLSRALGERGFAVTTAADGAAAIAAARRAPPDFAVVDLRMPGVSGQEVIDALVPLGAGIKIVVLTGYGSIVSAVEALHRGAHHYLSKPIDADELVATLLQVEGEAASASPGGVADDTGDGIDEDNDGITDAGGGHGTAVAGLVHLVAPAAVILPVRVLDDECHGTAFALADGIVRAVDAGARIINASLGAAEDSSAVEDALRYAADHDVLIVAAAGNVSTAPTGSPEPESPEVQFPAREEPSLAVAAVDSALVATPFTITGEEIGMSAPGDSLVLPWRSGRARASGTSFSTALVSGAAAVGLGVHPSLDRAGLVHLILSTAIPVDPQNRPDLQGHLGAGIPDVEALASSVVRPWSPRLDHRVREPVLSQGTPGRTEVSHTAAHACGGSD